MKTVDPRLARHLTQETTTLARLLKISRLDGTVLRFTDFDTDMVYDDGSGLPVIAHMWGPKTSAVSPWWALTNDAFSINTFVPNGTNSIFTYIAPSGAWAASQMFNGYGSAPNCDFLGTSTFRSKGTTFETVVSLHADYLNRGGSGSVGGIKSGISNGTLWGALDNYIGFEAHKGLAVGWGNWKLRMGDGVTPTLIDSGVPVGDTIPNADGSGGGVRTKLSFVVRADGGLVTWYINDIPVGGSIVNIPTGLVALSNHFESLSFTGSVFYRVESLTIYTPEVTMGTYVSADGVTFSALTNKDDGSPNNTEVTGFLTEAGVSAEDVRARLYDGATFEYRIVNWTDLSMREVKMLAGTIGDYDMKNGVFTAQLRGLTQKLTTVIGSLYGPLCRAELFGGGAEGIDPTNHWKCRLNRADWMQNGIVQVSTDSITLVPFNTPSVSTLVMRGSATPFAPAPAGWFDNGVIIFTSGVLNGYKFEIATWDGTALALFGGGPMPQSPAPGDTFQIEPGCDKRKSTCNTKFNNVINHAGEADIPGLNVIGAVSRTQVPTS